MTLKHKPNRLAKEKSPYLLQHAYNPVDWLPWGDEAFEKANQENKPIFLSIGYSTCHWCHVMAHESFEDEEVAVLLNKHFVSIKVDREERPDIDHLYMTICQALTGQGGWPLTIVMTPEKKAFFAGTYFPKQRKYGRIGLIELLTQLREKWDEDGGRVAEVSEQILQEVQERMLLQIQGDVGEEIFDKAFEYDKQTFDPQYGGFGGAPKFPTPHHLSFLLRYHLRAGGKKKALFLVTKTLDQMFRGGIYDHIGYGFARYSVDERWLVPHFEKMLYDNALLAWTYLETYRLTCKSHYAEAARQIFSYILRDMTDPEGGFYSAEDADSEGHEGKFYIWSHDEVLEVLGPDEGGLYCDVYDITEEGNFEGANIPNLIRYDIATYARLKGINPDELFARLETSRKKLFAHREKRVHPGKDDKILTSWNGLMIMALAQGFRTLGDPVYRDAAVKAARFVLTRLRREDGRLLARYRDGEAAYLGYADDYAFMVWGLLELYEATFEAEFLAEAVHLNAQMLELFWDEEQGGLYFYGSDSEQLVIRTKEIYDGAIPSGNAVAAANLLKLARLTYDAKLSRYAERLLQAFGGSIKSHPAGHSMMLIALDLASAAPGEIVIAGDPADETMQQMIALTRKGFRPHTMTVLVPNGNKGKEVAQLVPLVQDKPAIGGKATAYVCENFACQSPVTDVEELAKFLLPDVY